MQVQLPKSYGLVIRCRLPRALFPVSFVCLHREIPQAVTKEADGTLTLTLEDGEKVGGFDQILVATGRKPMLDRLGLENAGVKTNRGYITVGLVIKRAQTANDHGLIFEITHTGQA